MMALVEDDAADAARGCFLFLRLRDTQRVIDRRLMQHQGMVDDDDRSVSSGPDRALDEAAAVMRAGGINALAALVGEAQRIGCDAAALAVNAQVAEQGQYPGREIAAHHVAVAGKARPPRNECRQKRSARVDGGQAAEDFLHVEEADVILAALADDDAGAALVRIGHQPRGFLIQLPLEIFGIGRDPDGGVVLFGPQVSGRQIAQRLAEARSRFGEEDIVLLLLLAGQKSEGGSARIIFLGLAVLGVSSQNLAQEFLRFRRADGVLTAGAASLVLVPFLHPVPGVESGGESADIELRVGLEEDLHRGLGPGPFGAGQEIGVLGGFARQRVMAVA